MTNSQRNLSHKTVVTKYMILIVDVYFSKKAQQQEEAQQYRKE